VINRHAKIEYHDSKCNEITEFQGARGLEFSL